MASLHNERSGRGVMDGRSPKARRDFGEDIRRRIRSVRNTQQLTKAMSMPGAELINQPVLNLAEPDAAAAAPAMAWR